MLFDGDELQRKSPLRVLASGMSIGDCAPPILQVSKSFSRSPHFCGPVFPVYDQWPPPLSFAPFFSAARVDAVAARQSEATIEAAMPTNPDFI